MFITNAQTDNMKLLGNQYKTKLLIFLRVLGIQNVG